MRARKACRWRANRRSGQQPSPACWDRMAAVAARLISIKCSAPLSAAPSTSMRWTTCPRARLASCTAALCSLRSSRGTGRASRCVRFRVHTLCRAASAAAAAAAAVVVFAALVCTCRPSGLARSLPPAAQEVIVSERRFKYTLLTITHHPPPCPPCRRSLSASGGSSTRCSPSPTTLPPARRAGGHCQRAAVQVRGGGAGAAPQLRLVV